MAPRAPPLSIWRFLILPPSFLQIWRKYIHGNLRASQRDLETQARTVSGLVNPSSTRPHVALLSSQYWLGPDDEDEER